MLVSASHRFLEWLEISLWINSNQLLEIRLKRDMVEAKNHRQIMIVLVDKLLEVILGVLIIWIRNLAIIVELDQWAMAMDLLDQA